MDRIPVLDVTPEKIVYEMSESTENTTIDLTQVEDIDALEAGDIYQVPFKKYLEFKDFNRDKYKMCEVCIADQKRRYNGRTPIECTGLKDFDAIMETRYTGEEKEALKEGLEALEVDERAALQGQFSPTDWFKHNTNSPDTYTERWYQTLITSCSAKKRVLRMGRRCIEENELVLMSDGSYKKIKDINVGDTVVSYKEGSTVINKVSAVMNNGLKDLYKIKTTDGKEVVLTDNHPILTDKGWLTIEDGLVKGMSVAHLPKFNNISDTNNITIDEAKLLGYLLTDGYLTDKTNQTLKATFNNYLYIDEISNILKNKFGYSGTIKKRSECDAFDIWLTDGNHGTKNTAKIWLNSLNLLEEKYKLKNSVQLISKMPEESLKFFINRAFAGDGCISTSFNKNRPNGLRGAISFDTGDISFAKTISNILFRFGIPNNITYCKERKSFNTVSKDSWKIRVASSYGIKLFFKTFGFIYGKETQSKRLYEAIAQRSKTYKYSDSLDFQFIKIKSIENLNTKGVVYDITVENDANFVTNGIVTHNCGKTYSAAMYVLHKIATSEKKINVLVVAPMQTHLDEIVKTLKDLCDVLSYKLWESKRSTPIVEITFVNGSTVQCVVGANDGTSARGKKADLLWIDETDFVSSKVLEALKAIEMDNPNVETIYTSTPIGEGNLYRFSQSEQVKEFHYPSYVIPHYNEQIHASNKADLGEVAFVQEILALFGVDEHGAFPIRFIDRAETYNIPQVFNEHYVLSNRDKFIVTIGVDWNHDNNGTRILVVAYHKEIERFFVAEKFRISKLNYTQALAVEKVVELNRKYHADHIGCDQGFGAAQIAALRLEGKAQYGKVPHDHPDLKLTKVEAVDFGSSIELRDPITRKILKKKAKQFIVENTLHYLEEARIALDDIEDNELILQLKNYSIVKKTLAGNVYKAKDKKIGDHDLDALMIALYIFEKIYGTMLSAGNLEHTSPAYIGGGDVIDAKSRTAFANQTPSFQTAIPAFNGRKKFKPRKKW